MHVSACRRAHENDWKPQLRAYRRSFDKHVSRQSKAGGVGGASLKPFFFFPLICFPDSTRKQRQTFAAMLRRRAQWGVGEARETISKCKQRHSRAPARICPRLRVFLFFFFFFPQLVRNLAPYTLSITMSFTGTSPTYGFIPKRGLILF